MNRSLVTLVLLAAAGCAADPGGEGAPGASTGEALTGGIDVPNPSGEYFASLTANGTGCPAGSWEASISPDGQEFAVAFSAYEASISPGQAFAVSDCTLALDLKSPSGLSFAVTDFTFQGVLLLDSPGMSASQTTKYYFQGNPVPAKESRYYPTGPYDGTYLFHDPVTVADLVWSPCGITRRLNAQSRLVVQNNPKKTGTGDFKMNAMAGDSRILFRWNLTWRTC